MSTVRNITRTVVPRALHRPLLHLYHRIHTLIEKTFARRAPLRRHSSLAGVLDCNIAYNDFGGYCLPLRAIVRGHEIQTVLRGEVWQPETIAYIRQHCGTGDVVHAGAYFGDSVPAIAGGLAPGAKLWAFEPNPDYYRCLAITKIINRLDNAELIEAGLDREGGAADLVVTLNNDDAGPTGWIASQPPHWLKNAPLRTTTATVPIQVTTIDKTIPADRNLSVIYLTVSGNEPNALQGGAVVIARCKPAIIVRQQGDAEWPGAFGALGYRKIARLDGINVVMRA
jgi:FkbM family methyltransferase